MNIVVCIKQVPGTTDIKIDPKTNTLVREGVQSIINPFDCYAIEEGVRLPRVAPVPAPTPIPVHAGADRDIDVVASAA